MKFNTPYAKKNKLSILKGAIEELQSLTYDDGRQIIKDLKFSTEKKGRRISKYIFSFKPFSIDLNYIKRIEGNNITFASQLSAPDNQIEYTRIIEKFLETFSGRKEYDNKNNRKKLIAFCKSMSEEVVEEALDRVAMNKKRGAGWLFRTLENWEKNGVKKLEDIKQAEDEIFSKTKKTNVPSWSNPNYVNTTKIKSAGYEITTDDKDIFGLGKVTQEAAISVAIYPFGNNTPQSIADAVKATAPADVKFLASVQNNRAYVNKFANNENGGFTYNFVAKNKCGIMVLLTLEKDEKYG